MQPRVTTAETAATIAGGFAYGAAAAPPANDYDWFVLHPCSNTTTAAAVNVNVGLLSAIGVVLDARLCIVD